MHHSVSSTIFYILGYTAGIYAFVWFARRRRLSTEGIYYLLAAGLIGGLAGANIVQYLVTGIPGKTVIGGIVCGYLTVVIAKRALGIRRPTGDLFAFGISAGEAIGRWGCFFAGCCGGKLAPSWVWPRVFQDGAWRYPTQAYDSLANASILLLLVVLLKRDPPENTLFFVQGFLYCVARFAIEFTRTSSTLPLGLTAAQLACIVGAIYFGARGMMLMASLTTSPFRIAAGDSGMVAR